MKLVYVLMMALAISTAAMAQDKSEYLCSANLRNYKEIGLSQKITLTATTYGYNATSQDWGLNIVFGHGLITFDLMHLKTKTMSSTTVSPSDSIMSRMYAPGMKEEMLSVDCLKLKLNP